ncbi:unnamed protein product [Nippostrongylus brasiliensis]|uniref:Integrator complex subunit 2 (inferred by orthology to a human protein) n=1 Tax=Nippostrongylus brasiliensis TaxID=27835 RepID=A0A0N4Y9R2_NIPBR|nr:unnamed protein product [Nippostrongylus brasiliensis]
MVKWDFHAGVYCAIVNGSLTENGEKFSDEELRPFLPLLASCLTNPSPSASKVFLSKICSLAMKTGLMPYLSLDYQRLENEITTLSKAGASDNFANLEPSQKLITLCQSLQKVISIEDLATKLLSIKDGADVLTQVVGNVSETYLPLVSFLLDMSPVDQIISSARLTTITNLVSLNPPLSHSILDRMAEMRKECMFATRVVCERLDDEAVCLFLRSHLLDRKGLVSAMIGKSATKHTAAVVLNRLLGMISSATSKHSTEPMTDLLFSIVCLYHRCGLKLPPSDLTQITTFICRRHLASDGHLAAALAALIATPTLTFSMSVPVALSYQVEPHISLWFEWLRSETEKGHRKALARDLLYVGLGIVGGRSDAICTYFTETLRLQKVSIHQRHMEQWKTLFVNSCLSEADITARCATLPITTSLSASSGSRLPIHAMAELMSANAFAKHSVDISGVFSGDLLDESRLPVRILVLLYLLCYKTRVDANKSAGIYSNDTYMRLPVRYLLSVMEVRYEDFATARCHLIRLATDLFPYMLPTVDSLTIAKSRSGGEPIIEENEAFGDLLCSANFSEAMTAAQRLNSAPLSDQVRLIPCLARAFLHSLDSFPQSEEDRTSREVLAHALDHSQTSILVQVLIEVSDSRRMNDDPRNSSAIARRCEVRKQACAFIHQMFIQDKNLMKLVLFQTWPIEMIRPLVENTPSMFVAAEYIQEMLSLPDMKRRIFAVCLMAEVGRKYRLPESAASLNLVIDVLNSLLKFTQMPGNHAIFTAITPSLGHIVPVFPQLAPLVSALLLRISSVSRSQLAMNCLDARPPGSRERRLANMVERVMSSRLFISD